MLTLVKNIGLLVSPRSGAAQGDLTRIPDAAILMQQDEIKWVGTLKDLPRDTRSLTVLDARGLLAIPGLIDCHTHLAFAGWRSDEFEQRLKGKSYLDIAKAGGGILSTVAKTRDITKSALTSRCLEFLSQMAALGVTTVECKSGYGLSVESEIKILEVYRDLVTQSPLTIVPTFLGAHTVPAEFKDKRQDYVTLVCQKMLPQVAEQTLADFCDIFVEESAFTGDEARLILNRARALGLHAKLHVDQLSNQRGAELAAELGVISADHLEFISEGGVKALSSSRTVAVSLPIASLYTRQKFLNARRLLDHKVPVAVATDFNPGSAPTFHLPWALNLACTGCGMTPAEALDGATRIAARALQREDKYGTIESGKKADITFLDSSSPEFWLYHLRPNDCVATIKHGRVVHGALN